MGIKKNHTNEFKAKVAVAAVREAYIQGYQTMIESQRGLVRRLLKVHS